MNLGRILHETLRESRVLLHDTTHRGEFMAAVRDQCFAISRP
jgi:hypothetical protein